ncbi:N-acetylglucosaminyltransferase [filamentous cyanobacterium CCP5]|nr:N-acetylglucosaminyltransferase [filamentous cyanobacterium CCP5]
MIVAYLIQAHRDPHQVCRLIRSIRAGNPSALILIAYDFTNSRFNTSLLKDFSNTYLLKGTRPVIRGGISAIQPYFDAIEWLIDKGYDFDWLVYISGQCYPVQSTAKLEIYLSSTQKEGFIDYFNILSGQSKWSIQEGYERYYYHKISDLPAWTMLPSRMINKMSLLDRFPYAVKSRPSFGVSLWQESQHPPFTDEFICYGGNHRHVLSRACVDYLNSFLLEKKEIFDYFCETWCPEEAIVQTILVNSRKFNLSNDNKIFDDYEHTRDGSPRILEDSDFEEITNGKYFFARKIDPYKSSKLLDMLDAHLL